MLALLFNEQSHQGIVCFSDGGFRPDSGLVAAGWVVVVVYNNDINNGGSESPSIINLCDSSHRCAEKPAEGVFFLPTCRSSYEAELVAVSQLIMHVDSFMTDGSFHRSRKRVRV